MDYVMLPERMQANQQVCGDGQVRVVLEIQGPYGQLGHVIDPKAAAQIGAILVRLGEAGQLVLPGPAQNGHAT